VGTGYLIDSNVVIGYLDGRIPEKGMKFLHTIVDDIPHVSVITKMEVLRFNAPEKAYQVLSDFMNNSLVYNLSDPIVSRTIQLGKNHKIKLPDAIIAATALVHDLTLLTRNMNDFKNISNLSVVNPYDM
jgi:predicted nucleic acid-binding protein